MNTDIVSGDSENIGDENLGAFFPQIFTICTMTDVAACASGLLSFEYDTLKEIHAFKKKSQNSDAINIFYDLLKNIFYRDSNQTNRKGKPFTILIENFFVDPIYRDSYYFHYAAKHFDYERFCKRIYFLDAGKSEVGEILKQSETSLNKKLIGMSIIRPASDQKWIVGKTLLNPEFFNELKNCFICVADFKISMFGKRLSVRAFPYMMQDAEVITCAETTILHLLDYFSNKYNLYRSVLPSEIAQIEQTIAEQRIMPSQGLSYQTVSHILTQLNFHPRLYGFDSRTKDNKRKRIMHYYIDSAIPVAVSLTPKNNNGKISHSIVGIGIVNKGRTINQSEIIKLGAHYYMDSADMCSTYITMNDSSAPYTEMEFVSNNMHSLEIKLGKLKYKFSMTSLIAPLSKRMFLNAEDARAILFNVLTDSELGFANILAKSQVEKYNNIGKSINNPIIYRLFLARGSSFKRKRSAAIPLKKTYIRNIYNSLPLPKFVWVCELYDSSSFENEKAIGEIVIDATANNSSGTASLLLINYPHTLAYRLPNEPIECLYSRYLVYNKETWNEISSYKHNKI